MPNVRFKAALIAGCALAGVGATWAAMRSFGEERRVMAVTVAGNRLRIDSAYLAPAQPEGDGAHDSISVIARFPNFLPAQLSGRAGEEAARDVVVTLLAPEGAMDPADRPAKLYARFLEADVWSHPGGLIVRQFEEGGPYENEELYMAPPEGRAFFARCMRPPQPPDGLPNTCLTELRQSGLDARIRFSPELLADWQALMAGARGLIRSFLRTG
jgi:hypothetical protein